MYSMLLSQRCPKHRFRIIEICRRSCQSFLDTQKSNDPIRLSKYVSNMGKVSRREAEKLIRKGRVSLNGSQIDTPFAIVMDLDSVKLDGIEISSTQMRSSSTEIPELYAVYKLSGELCADKDNLKKRPLMMQRLQKLPIPSGQSNELKLVNRLEFQIEGLCLVTSSGKLAKLLNSDSLKLKKHYRIRIHGLVTESKLSGLRKGMYIEGKKQTPMDVSIDKTTGNTISWWRIASTERHFKTIKHCLEKMHLNVTRTICVGFGPYQLGAMAPGQIQRLQLSQDIVGKLRGL